MITTTTKTPLDYFEVADDAGTPFLLLYYRNGRFPVRRTVVTSAGSLELTGDDGVVEVLGSAEHPCSAAVLKRIRVHHEGLLLVQVDATRVDGVTEQLLSARFN